jgi:hypothetical protein
MFRGEMIQYLVYSLKIIGEGGEHLSVHMSKIGHTDDYWI